MKNLTQSGSQIDISITQRTKAWWQNSKLSQVIKGFNKGFFILLIYELIEEALEEFIAWGITTAIAKAISFLLVVFLTQATKVTAKSIVVVLKPVIKKLIYVEGNDKMEKLKSFFANIKANWKNYLSIVSAVATAIIPFVQNLMDFGIGIQVFGFNIVPFAMIILTSIVAIVGVFVDGVHGNSMWTKIVETKNAFTAEVAKQKQEAKASAEAEKLVLKEQAEAKKAIEAQKKAEFEALVAKKKAELEAQKNI